MSPYSVIGSHHSLAVGGVKQSKAMSELVGAAQLMCKPDTKSHLQSVTRASSASTACAAGRLTGTEAD